jgi:hypothetical protein
VERPFIHDGVDQAFAGQRKRKVLLQNLLMFRDEQDIEIACEEKDGRAVEARSKVQKVPKQLGRFRAGGRTTEGRAVAGVPAALVCRSHQADHRHSARSEASGDPQPCVLHVQNVCGGKMVGFVCRRWTQVG